MRASACPYVPARPADRPMWYKIPFRFTVAPLVKNKTDMLRRKKKKRKKKGYKRIEHESIMHYDGLWSKCNVGMEWYKISPH